MLGPHSAAETAFSLYVHIPYCRTKCPYCDFNSYAAASWPEERYVSALIRELEHRRREEPWRDHPVETVFFGGGTPSLFSAASIARVLAPLREAAAIVCDPEITLEANPGTVSVESLRRFREAGVNRLSFGIQSFHPHVLKLLGRLHTVRETRLALPMAREADFGNVNLDLIFAVPGQSLDDWRSDLDTVIAFEPDHVSAYNLTYEEGTPFHELRRTGALQPHANDVEAEMFEQARERLERAGYQAYEISNFAKPGRESRHNVNYWRGGAYLGLGAGAHSYAPLASGGRRWWNEKDPERYIALGSTSGDASAGEEELALRPSAAEFLFLNLRLASGFAEARFTERFGAAVDTVVPELESLVAEGLLERRAGRIALTSRGLLVADEVFATFV